MKFNKYWTLFFFIKFFYMIFALLIYSKITILGDTDRWMDGVIEYTDISKILFGSTAMIDYIGGISSKLFGNLIGNLPFMLLSFYGIYYSVSKFVLSKKQLIFLFFLLSLPTFSIWSSIAGKEAIGVFFMGIILGYIINILEYNRYKLKLIEYFAFYLMFVFKAQYSLAIFSVIFYIYLSRKFSLSKFGKLNLLIIHIVLTIIVFYIFRNIINELSFIMPKHFSLDGGSTRENTIWINDYDVFLNAPYGMFIAFWGPTFSEIINKPIQSLVFIENFFIMSFFMFFLFKFIVKLSNYKVNIFAFTLFIIPIFWLLFVHYPFGALNPGAALRYRENFYAFIVVYLFYIYTKYLIIQKKERV